ncbi:deoxyribodipyrimidine photo-lyase [Niveomyces insectorum RCEF 264]|uniref:Deoxyribodipyrimidine photo-lyase n=1 Tax=Niveomyces insectorum RCEF 264 TaxID=1081102 RepID=A0A162ICS3_9HYPO|nr:deoxyribodipyrimidine photo-lyase [Niveomyces insectorum RCEF 264]
MPRENASSKRKASASQTSPSGEPSSGPNGRKKAKTAKHDALHQPHPRHALSEDHGIVLRRYYPPEMSNKRASAYANGKLPKPIDELQDALDETADQRMQVQPKDAVVHWFKTDLRMRDNRALAMASEKARAAGVPLICLYVVSPQDWEAHLRSPARVDLILRTLHVLKADLAALNIPLWIETADKRQQVPDRVLARLQTWGASHLFANMEYEVDELRRDAKLVRRCAAQGIAMTVIHDTCIVPPGTLASSTGNGRPYAVFTPWYRAWMQHIHQHEDLLVDLAEPPAAQSAGIRDKISSLFDCPVPHAPKNKRLDKEEAKRFRTLWPAGEHEAMARLNRFCDERLTAYAAYRDFPARDATSTLSPYLASGALSARTAVQTARTRAAAVSLDGGDSGNEGFQSWAREVAWRDFYRHVLVGWPYVCMNKPFKPAYADIEWSYDQDRFAAWTEGRTGYPIVDAAMRQLRYQGWLHNRCRIIVASFLAKDLLLDWRMGEKYFMEHLIDGDFSNNNGGWGYAASVGVDPQPYFRIINPILQSERFDPDGRYIRQWVPELRSSIEDGSAAIHEPYARGDVEKLRASGYPEPIVQHHEARERALAAYKQGIANGKK